MAEVKCEIELPDLKEVLSNMEFQCLLQEGVDGVLLV